MNRLKEMENKYTRADSHYDKLHIMSDLHSGRNELENDNIYE